MVVSFINTTVSFFKKVLFTASKSVFRLWFDFENQVDICSETILCEYCKGHWIKYQKIFGIGPASTTNQLCELQQEIQSHWLSICVCEVRWLRMKFL